MSLDTYSGLKTEIEDWLDRDDLPVDTLIDLAESRHKREIRIREMIQRQQADLDARYESLPTGFIKMRELRILSSPVTVLRQVDPHEMTRLRQSTTGKPAYFAVHEELEFDRAPDSTYTMEMVFWKALTPLSDSNTSNALLTRAPDAYLWAALAASAPWLTNDERVSTWDAAYVSVRDALNTMDRDVGGQLVSRVYGATP